MCRPEWAADQTLSDRYYGLLDAGERQRYSRFHFAADRHIFLVSHALVRVALSRHANAAPEAWRFKKNEYGRPEIDAGEDPRRLRFNLSHTQGLVACVISQEFEVGIDIENNVPEIDVLGVADRICSPAEKSGLNSLSGEERLSRFLGIWTLKEAYAKARGLGFSLPFHQFTVEVSGKSILAHFDLEIGEDPNEWTFVLFKPTQNHRLAIAARSPGKVNALIRPEWFLPLGEMTESPSLVTIEADSRVA